MRSRGQSPLLPFTNSQRIPQKIRTTRRSAATRVIVGSLAALCLYAGYALIELRRQQSPGAAESYAGRGLAAHDEVAQLQGKDAPVLESENRKEVAQLQDEAARGADAAGQVHAQSVIEPNGLYTLEATDIDGERVDLAKYAGKVSLVVNVASQCGYTDSNYKGLQQLYDKYKASGFEILAFPCNSFGKQEPDTGVAIKEFARTRYGVTFPLFQKVEVTGPEAHPVFKFLADNLPASQGARDVWQPKWNFSKWLVSKRGMPVAHYDSAFDAAQLERDVAAELLKST